MGNVNSHHIDNLLLNTFIPLDEVDVIKEDDELVEVAMNIPKWLSKKVVSITRGEPICWRRGTAFHTYYITFYICHSFLMEIGITDMWAIDHSILPKIYKKFLKILAECDTPIQIDSRSMLEEAPKSSCSYSAVVDDVEKGQYKDRLMDMARNTGHIYEMDTTASYVIIGVPTAERTMHVLWGYNIPPEQFQKLDNQYDRLLQIGNLLSSTVSSIYTTNKIR